MNAYYSNCVNIPYWWIVRWVLIFAMVNKEQLWTKLHTCPINSFRRFLAVRFLDQNTCKFKYRNWLVESRRKYASMNTIFQDILLEGRRLTNFITFRARQVWRCATWGLGRAMSRGLWWGLRRAGTLPTVAPDFSTAKAFYKHTHTHTNTNTDSHIHIYRLTHRHTQPSLSHTQECFHTHTHIHNFLKFKLFALLS